MARYFRKPQAWREVYDCDDLVSDHVPVVSEHVAIDTGLIDKDGYPIMRAPNPIGFGKDEEW